MKITNPGLQPDQRLVGDKIVELLMGLDHKLLISIFPKNVLLDLSFYNFHHAVTACFFADEKLVIQKVNQKFQSFFPPGKKLVGQKISQIFSQLGLSKEVAKKYTDQLKSKKWANIPGLQINVNGRTNSFALYSSFTNSSELFPITGLQGQFVDKTEESKLRERLEKIEAVTGTALQTNMLQISEASNKILSDLNLVKSKLPEEIRGFITNIEESVSKILADATDSGRLFFSNSKAEK